MKFKRTASAAWAGGLKDGTGSISTGSGVLSNSRYGYPTRFNDAPGSNPEELIAAAHAGCFSMALAAQLDEAGLKAASILTNATVTLEKEAQGFSITAVHLETVARVPGATRSDFEDAADRAKSGCPVSKLLRAQITLSARLET